ncbi:lamin tail domain-containing protein 1 isoform X2 [Vulpes lagopus]|uniref:lamin tail domain-containing protein 1 isoform X2 n=1 Tax=Vulpes lagopus TaxID=494514 RepID=UPI001BC8DB2A|nr:lamin tail domain-containing protein 1 isoform X2 [Vulpes lagopus]
MTVGAQEETTEAWDQGPRLEGKSWKNTPQNVDYSYLQLEIKETFLLAKMKDMQASQETSVALQSELHEQEDKVENQAQREDPHSLLMRERSLVHFLLTTDSDTTLPFSRSLSSEMPLSYNLSNPQFSRITVSTAGQKIPRTTLVGHSRSENSLGVNSFIMTKKQALPVVAPETPVTGEGEDYFLSLFGDSKKPFTRSFHAEKAWKHFSMILEEVGQSRSSALGDIKIAEVNVKGLFVKLINSSLDKELEIGGHILQQNVNGQTISLYRFLPNVVMQANCTVTAVAWYTPIHWKQAWEKLETDIEFDRCSIVSPSQRHRFPWPVSITTTEEKQDKSDKDISGYQMKQVRVFLKREKENPPLPFPNSSPWCHSPNVPAHPYCPLIEPCNNCTAESSLDRQPRPQSSRPDPAQDNIIQI